jgi:ribonuclease HI
MSVLFKTLERLVLWHIEETCLSDVPMHKNQFGFRKGRSTEHALCTAVDTIEKGMNRGQYVLGVFCDISGAFDNVSFSSITTAMLKRGVAPCLVAWYEHFLRNRTVTSSLGSSTATVRPGKGAPQGGVLSAIIAWNLVFDDLLRKYDNSQVVSIGFADDGTLLVTGIDIPTIYSIMQTALATAADWAAQNGLKFCPKKTNAILFTRKTALPQLPVLQLNGEDVPNVKTTKMLGIMLDSKLSWSKHIDSRVNACKKALMMLRPILGRTWSPRPMYTRWLYTGVILPMLTYASVVWAGATTNASGLQKKLGKLQRLGLTSIACVRRGTPTAALEILYDVPPIHHLVMERARCTFLQLGELQHVQWTPVIRSQTGHLRELRRFFKGEMDDDMIEPVPNRDQPYYVRIDNGLAVEQQGITAYTDGSLMDGRAGAGACIWQGAQPMVTLSEKLPDCTIFQAEIRAIQMVCEFFDKNSRTMPITIYVDCQSVLQALRAPNITNALLRDTRDMLTVLAEANHTVTLQWVKAHAGTQGNEDADKAAKRGGASSRQTVMHFVTARQARKALIKETRNLDWAREWAENAACRQSKLFLKKPLPRCWQDLKSLSQTRTSRIIRFVTGHCHMNRHNTLLAGGYGALDSPAALCRLCEEEPETPEHLITECPVMTTTRLSTLYAWQLDTPPPWSPDLLAFINSTHIIALEERNGEDGM